MRAEVAVKVTTIEGLKKELDLVIVESQQRQALVDAKDADIESREETIRTLKTSLATTEDALESKVVLVASKDEVIRELRVSLDVSSEEQAKVYDFPCHLICVLTSSTI